MGALCLCSHNIGKNTDGLNEEESSIKLLTMAGSYHLDISHWLNTLGLSQYSKLFKLYHGVEDILDWSEADVKRAGVRNGAHRAKLVSSLVVLKDKVIKANRRHAASPRELCDVNYWVKRLGCSGSHRPVKMDPGMPITEVSPDHLKKELERELRLDCRDLRSHGWYHGTIPRQKAESLAAEPGMFLIRDCISQPGDFVLTCNCNGVPLHFMINRLILNPGTTYEHVVYHFENEQFHSIPDVVTFYVGSGKPLSQETGAKISQPVNRRMPLSYYDTKYGALSKAKYALSMAGIYSPSSPKPSPFVSPIGTPSGSPPMVRHNRRADSQPFLNDMSPASEKRLLMERTTSLPSVDIKESETEKKEINNTSDVIRIGSDPMLSPTIDRKVWDIKSAPRLRNVPKSDSDLNRPPPPKPSRVPTFRSSINPIIQQKKKEEVYYSEPQYDEPPQDIPEKDVDDAYVMATQEPPDKYIQTTGSIDSSVSSLIASQTYDKNGCKDSDARFSVVESDKQNQEDSIYDSAGEDIHLKLPNLEQISHFNLLNFTTLLLPLENKPLETPYMEKVRTILLENGSRILANHLTIVDLELLQWKGKYDWGLGVHSGLELITLPQGVQLRKDLVERNHCLSFFVPTTLLTCSTAKERAEMLHKWIQIAIETKTALGNMYGFSGIMQGLGLAQISRLKNTWLLLRQNFTDSAFTYETKLKPAFKSMNEATNPQAPNTSIPYFLPLIHLLERDIATDLNTSFSWEDAAADYGLEYLYSHLDAGRNVAKQCGFFKRNAELVLDDIKLDEQLLDLFKTELQLKIQWGSKGAGAPANERYSKFEQLLTVMSQRCEPD